MYSPDGNHDLALQKRPLLAFDEAKPFEAQSAQIRRKILECLGEMPEQVPLNPTVEEYTEHESFNEYRISFDVEQAVRAVCVLCIPRNITKKVPLVICLQGHGTGMHVSLGRKKYPGDEENGPRAVASQALARGFAALCLDQRGMGERRTEKGGYSDSDMGAPRCRTTAMTALLLGRTLLGERCWDVSRAIDLALTYPEIDGSRIACTGNSGGGTTTYYAAVFDERISVAMPSCSVCTFRDSIGAMLHCECNYVPGLARFVDMGDMAAAIAPRRLVLINGVYDGIFPKNGVDETCNIIRAVYKSAGVPERFAHCEGDGGHCYYEARAWSGFEAVTGGLWH